MNPQDEKPDTPHNSAYNPFPEPQTIPTGWDTSEFLAAPSSAAAEQADVSPESEAH